MTTELGQPELKSETWFGLLAPAGTPTEVIQKINGAINQALATPEFKAKLVQMGFTTMGGTPQEFVDTLAADIEKWGEIVKFSGAQRD
ncbi:tripartite tricarboxylate transporter substrate-binding protein [Achromobacter sp. F4_2707]|uniref:Bug family tripartite tricarboxylate transporter substrate binding protein n=1 Tax=Achromobacter sp. F4_2707 TaxID=3114286 RepID=UPI0039C64CF4